MADTKTGSVKTAVSIESTLFEQAERTAREMQISRSRLYNLALEDYLRHRENQELLRRLNEAYADDLDEEERAFLHAGMSQASKRVDTEW